MSQHLMLVLGFAGCSHSQVSSPVRALAPAPHTAERPGTFHSEHQWLLKGENLVLNEGSFVTSDTNVKKPSTYGSDNTLRAN